MRSGCSQHRALPKAMARPRRWHVAGSVGPLGRSFTSLITNSPYIDFHARLRRFAQFAFEGIGSISAELLTRKAREIMTFADSARCRPPFRNDLARHSEMISPTIPG